MKCSEVTQILWDDFNVAYADSNVFKWSVWWSLSLSGYVLVNIFYFLKLGNFIQLLILNLLFYNKSYSYKTDLCFFRFRNISNFIGKK